MNTAGDKESAVSGGEVSPIATPVCPNTECGSTDTSLLSRCVARVEQRHTNRNWASDTTPWWVRRLRAIIEKTCPGRGKPILRSSKSASGSLDFRDDDMDDLYESDEEPWESAEELAWHAARDAASTPAGNTEQKKKSAPDRNLAI